MDSPLLNFQNSSTAALTSVTAWPLKIPSILTPMPMLTSPMTLC